MKSRFILVNTSRGVFIDSIEQDEQPYISPGGCSSSRLLLLVSSTRTRVPTIGRFWRSGLLITCVFSLTRSFGAWFRRRGIRCHRRSTVLNREDKRVELDLGQ